MKCVVCGNEGPDKISLGAQDWDWFTGYLPETVHFCPSHKASPERQKLWQESQERPVALDMKTCPTCKGTGRVRRELPLEGAA
jgi:hypothetical protein